MTASWRFATRGEDGKVAGVPQIRLRGDIYRSTAEGGTRIEMATSGKEEAVRCHGWTWHQGRGARILT